MTEPPFRILLVDDEPTVQRAQARLLERCPVEITTTARGAAAVALVETARSAGRPFAVMIVDSAMPGWDGIATTRRAWQHDPELQVVLCVAADCAPDDVLTRLDTTDALVVIKKPFAPVELVQATLALTTKWQLARRARAHVEELEAAVRARTAELEAANQRLADQLAWRDRIETELRLAQRLEAVGQLAAGVAHEINTPIQYVGDNVRFLCEGSTELLRATQAFRMVAMSYRDENIHRQIAEIDESIDLEYLAAELPNAGASIEVGVRRIGSTVKALKELCQPGVREAKAANLNRTLEHALEVSAHTYRFVADVDKQLDPLPMVTCHVAELAQVFVNLIVNAAHAMDGRAERGRLGVRTRVDGPHVVIAISDTGTGIPEEIRDRIFDPFFTTKEVGLGTGQGLAIARAIVARHRGMLSVDSTVGVGTTFQIRLPIDVTATTAA